MVGTKRVLQFNLAEIEKRTLAIEARDRDVDSDTYKRLAEETGYSRKDVKWRLMGLYYGPHGSNKLTYEQQRDHLVMLKNIGA